MTFKDYQNITISVDEIVNFIKESNFQVIGMQTYVSNINMCLKMSSIIKEKLPDIKIILGGPHATIFPDKIIKHSAIDLVCIGEGEITVQELADYLKICKEPTDILGLYYKDKQGQIYKNERRPFVEDLDVLQMPKYEIFDREKYFPAAHIRGKNVMNIITARGCPYSCSFCAATEVWGNRYRFHSVERAIKEIKYLKENFSVDSLQIYDDNFTTKMSRVKEFCRRMIKEELNLEWVCYTRADALDDEEMIGLMKSAGCYMIVVGIENGNERVLNFINKKLDLEEAKKGIVLANKHNIRVLSSFMIGLPSKTLEEIERTIQLSKNIGLSYAFFPIFTPYPGTPIYEVAKEYGTITNEDLDKYSRWGNGVYSSGDLTLEIYRKMQKKAFRQFYLRPSIIYSVLKEFTRLPSRRIWRFIKGGASFLWK